MINESEEIFGIPEVLATDIHAYWENKEKNTFVSLCFVVNPMSRVRQIKAISPTTGVRF